MKIGSKSTDGGINYEAIYFANSGALVRDLEISRNNPELMYAVIRKGSNSMELRKTNDDWQAPKSCLYHQMVQSEPIDHKHGSRN